MTLYDDTDPESGIFLSPPDGTGEILAGRAMLAQEAQAGL